MGKKPLHIGLPGWIGVGAVCGVATGLVAGESCKVLQPVGTAYVMLLESVVYPYLISSLLHGLGRLSSGVALRLFKKSWHFYLAVWGVTLGCAYLLNFSFPALPLPTAIDATLPERAGPDLLQLILPGNIFHDLSNNYVPAVVVLSVLFGVAIQSAPGKDSLLGILALVRGACVRIWNWVVTFAPFAVFAMFAVTAGTIESDKIAGMLIYVFLFLTSTFLLAFVAIPMALSALMPVTSRMVLKELRSAIVLSMVTTLSVVALPFIQQAAEKLAKRNGIEDENSREIIETSLAVSYPLGQLGNFFVYFFILFASFNTRTILSGMEQMALPFMTLFSCIGSPTSTVNAVDFLSSWLHLPGKPLELYIETMTMTRYGQVALSVMGFAFLTYSMTFNYYERLKISVPRLVGCGLLILVCVIGLGAGGHVLISDALTKPQSPYLYLRLPGEITKGVNVKVYKTRAEFQAAYPEPKLKPGESVIDRIQRTHTLRVGYAPGIIPFTYFNKHGQLVGYDIACAYDLAKSLNVRLVLAPVSFNKVKQEAHDGVFDIFMGGVYVTAERMHWGKYSQSYYQSPMALIVPAERADDFVDMTEIRQIPDLSIAIFDDPLMIQLAKRLFPDAKQMALPSIGYDALPTAKGWDAALWTYGESCIWVAANPGYAAVKPKNMGAVMVIAYYLPKQSFDMLQFINSWMALRKADGFLAKQQGYWMD